MKCIGHVSGLDGELADIVLGHHVECRRCGACLAASSGKDRSLRAANPVGALVGERVEVEIEPARAVGAAFLMFILPLVAAVGGGIAGHRLGPLLGMPAAAAGIATGVLCLALAFVVLRRVERATRHRLPEIVRVIRDDQPEGGY